MLVIDNSIKDEYHTQINNKLIPLQACNVTSYVMFGKYNHCLFDYPKDQQPEDYFMSVMMGNEKRDESLRRFPSLARKAAPWEIHELLASTYNEMVGKEVARFVLENTTEDLIAELINGKVCIVSGRFAGLGHIVVLVGLMANLPEDYDTSEGIERTEVKSFIIDDPYGDYKTRYMSHQGNNVDVPYGAFMRMTNFRNEPDRKWAHLYIGK